MCHLSGAGCTSRLLHELPASILRTSFHLCFSNGHIKRYHHLELNHPRDEKGHNLRQPQPPKGRSSPDTKARTVLIAISTTALPLFSSHSYPPAPPQKHIQVAGVQEDFPPFLLALFRLYTVVMEQ